MRGLVAEDEEPAVDEAVARFDQGTEGSLRRRGAWVDRDSGAESPKI